MAETLISHPEDEPQLPIEYEHKYLVQGMELTPWLNTAKHVEQVYLSQPDEDWSLRVRKTLDRSGEPTYEATLKSRPGTQSRGLLRQEVNTPISEEAYYFYAKQDLPRIHKLRAEICEGVTMDWLFSETSGPEPFVLEIEGKGPEQTRFYEAFQEKLTDVSHHPKYQSELFAHASWPSNIEKTKRVDLMLIEKVVVELAKSMDRPIVVGVKGRSGSGKSTLVSELASFMEFACDMPSITLSTDDYNRGKQWLLDKFAVETWSNWDSPVVYNTAGLAFDLREYLGKGELIPRRRYDYSTEEAVIEPDFHPLARIIFVEGLYPHAAELDGLIDHMVEVPTPLATCVGRRILRDLKTRMNGSFTNAADILRYQLEVAEPIYKSSQVQ